MEDFKLYGQITRTSNVCSSINRQTVYKELNNPVLTSNILSTIPTFIVSFLPQKDAKEVSCGCF